MFRFFYSELDNYEGFQTGFAGLRGRTKARPHLRMTMVGATATGPDVFEAHYIPMAGVDAGREAHHWLMPGSTGPNLALTSQLSGCTIGIGSATSDGGRLVSHVSPPFPDAVPTAADAVAMRQAASLGSMDRIFDRASQNGPRSYASVNNRATVVGVRHESRWRFFAQTLNVQQRWLLAVEELTH